MKVLLTVASVARSHGGPARSVSLLAHHLAKAGAEVGLWAADGSGAAPPLLPPGSLVRTFDGSVEKTLEDFGPFDLLHDNGLWLPFHHKLAMWSAREKIPRLVSPRGMLEPRALDFKKWKKRAAWWVYQRKDLASVTGFHATAAAEKQTVVSRWPDHPVAVIPNGVEIPKGSMATPGSDSEDKVVLFVGRLHPIKGLPMLLHAWAVTRPVGWRLHIAGPSENGHRAELERLIGKLGIGDRVRLNDELDEDSKRQAMENANLFVLPSQTENFGIVVAEALACGIPVIATQGTPWQSLEEERCGWWVPGTTDGMANALRDATHTPLEKLSLMGERGKKMVERDYSWDRIVADMGKYYESLLSRC